MEKQEGLEEIKIRAWHTEDEKMLYMDDLGKCTLNYLNSAGHLKIMKSTGLKDKDDKEIYEGDIVKLLCGGKDSNTTACGIIAIIVYEDCRFEIKFPEKNYEVHHGSHKGQILPDYEIHSWSGMHTCLSEHSSAWGYQEVVGNIYENKELLK